MKRNAVLPNFFTALSLCCGLFVIFKMNMIPPGTAVFDQVLSCVKILLAAAVFDVLDGALARAMNVKTKFGAFFDSMADAVSFAVAPSVLVLKSLSMVPGTVFSAFLTVGAVIYSVAGILRLVRYSVIAMGSSPNLGPFSGLPVPCAGVAIIAPTLLLMGESVSVSAHTHAVIATVLFFVLSYLMLSRWKFPSIKAFNMPVTSTRLLVITVALFSLLLFLALHNFPVVLLLASWGYIIFSVVTACMRLTKGGQRLMADDELEEEVEP